MHWRSDVLGGAEIALLDLINILKDSYEIDNLFHRKGEVSDYYFHSKANVIIRHIETKRRKYPGLHLVQSLLLAKFLRKKGYDCVICNTFPATSRVATACRISKTPLISFVRDHFSYSPVNKKLLGKPLRLIAVSKNMQEHALRFNNNLNVHVVYDYIASDKYTMHDTKPCSGDEKASFKIGIVGRIQTIKQHHILINAVKILINENKDISLLIYGEPGPSSGDQEYFKILKKLVEELHLERHVHFKGFYNEIVPEIKKLDILAIVSTNEAFPRVVLEAQLCKVPVIGSMTGGILEQIDHLRTGILVDLNNQDPAKTIANSILMLFDSKQLREEIAVNAFKNCLRYFASKEYTIDSFNKVIASIE